MNEKMMESFNVFDNSKICSFCNLFYSVTYFMKQQLEDHVKNGHSVNENSGEMFDPEHFKHKENFNINILRGNIGDLPEDIKVDSDDKSINAKNCLPESLPNNSESEVFIDGESAVEARVKHLNEDEPKTENGLNDYPEMKIESKAKHTCKECDKTYITNKNLKHHMRKQHKPQRSAACNICEKVFIRGTNMRRHKRVQHEDDKKWPCEVCGKELSSKHTLHQHVKTHSEDRKFYICDHIDCSRSFLSARYLSFHKQTEHSDVKDYMCQVCGNEFKLPHLLKKHLLVHQIEKPFSCEHCGKGFKAASRLKEHVSIHTGEKPYKCGYCGTNIRSYPNLLSHLKRHRSRNHPLENEKEYFKVE